VVKPARRDALDLGVDLGLLAQLIRRVVGPGPDRYRKQRDQHGQQVELGGGHGHLLAVRVDQAAPHQIQFPATEAIDHAAIDRLGPGAQQDVAHAGDQFAGMERLGHVVVGAQFQAGDTVTGIGTRRDDDDGHS